MTNVNVYAGDNYLPAADAKYINLIWEEISGGIYIYINQNILFLDVFHGDSVPFVVG